MEADFFKMIGVDVCCQPGLKAPSLYDGLKLKLSS